MIFQGHSETFCVKKMKEECVTFCFIKLNVKVCPKSSGEKGRDALSKLIFTHFVPAEAIKN